MFSRFLPALLIAASLALVTVGGVVLATGGNNAEEDDLLEKVATELNLDPQVVKDALAQAQREAIKEKQDEILADLVESGAISQEQADSAGAWLDSRPASADKLLLNRAIMRVVIEPHLPSKFLELYGAPSFGPDGSLRDRIAEILGIEPEALTDAFETAQKAQSAERVAELLDEIVDQLIEEGELTAAEGDELKAWISQMPEWLTDKGVLRRLIEAGFLLFDSPPLFLSPESDEFRFAPPAGPPIPAPRGRFEFIRPFDPESGLPPECEETRSPGGLQLHCTGPDLNFEFEWEQEFQGDFESMLDGFEGRFHFNGFELEKDMDEETAPQPDQDSASNGTGQDAA